ncbi:MAG: hypothetical protein ACI8WP_000856, partial [Flavobacteriaceae bacterium]
QIFWFGESIQRSSKGLFRKKRNGFGSNRKVAGSEFGILKFESVNVLRLESVKAN